MKKKKKKGRKEDILVHKHLLLLFTKLAFSVDEFLFGRACKKVWFLGTSVSGKGGQGGGKAAG